MVVRLVPMLLEMPLTELHLMGQTCGLQVIQIILYLNCKKLGEMNMKNSKNFLKSWKLPISIVVVFVLVSTPTIFAIDAIPPEPIGGPIPGWGMNVRAIWDQDEDTGIQTQESPDEDCLRFDTAGVERMVINEDGIVSIGTPATPDTKLFINGIIAPNWGTTMDPSYRFGGGGENTGFSSPEPNTISIITDGVESVRINSDGNLTWKEKTSYVSVSAAAFTPSNENVPYINEGYTLWSEDWDWYRYMAPVQLPHGAIVTNITSYFYDHSIRWGWFYFYRNNMNGTTELMADGMMEVGKGSTYDNTIDYAIIDNSRYSYYLEWELYEDFEGYGVIIEYTFTEPY